MADAGGHFQLVEPERSRSRTVSTLAASSANLFLGFSGMTLSLDREAGVRPNSVSSLSIVFMLCMTIDMRGLGWMVASSD